MPDITGGVGGLTNVNQYKYSATPNSTANSVSMQDFLMLVVAQLQNQDMFSDQDNTQFMAQMAQMASMQAMQELTAAFMSSMSMSYIGKYAKAEALTSSGEHVQAEGFVDRVHFNGGKALVLIDNVWFNTSDVYMISSEKPDEQQNQNQNQTQTQNQNQEE